MVQPHDVSWGRYKEYEGPVFWGTVKHRLPKNPTESDRIIAVFTATEGGHYDAINMYDKCIISVGIAQWCEASQYSVSNMLGVLIETHGLDSVTKHLMPAMEASNVMLKKNSAGKWRFFFNDGRGEINTVARQREMFLGAAEELNTKKAMGLRGTWTPELTAHAKLWAACMANVWQSPEACVVQAKYTADKFKWFALTYAQTHLFDEGGESTNWVGAIRAAYLSFAGNNPKRANEQLKIELEASPLEKWSPEWCIGILKRLTFGPEIEIYPKRYNDIRPVLESLWGIELPANAKALSDWTYPVTQVEPDVAAPVVIAEVPIVLNERETMPDLAVVRAKEVEAAIKQIPFPAKGDSPLAVLVKIFSWILQFFAGKK